MPICLLKWPVLLSPWIISDLPLDIGLRAKQCHNCSNPGWQPKEQRQKTTNGIRLTWCQDGSRCCSSREHWWALLYLDVASYRQSSTTPPAAIRIHIRWAEYVPIHTLDVILETIFLANQHMAFLADHWTDVDKHNNCN